MRYDKYKDSGIEWIGEIPEHWEISTIGRISKLGRGRVINVFEMEANPGQYPVYSSQTKNNGVMGYLGTFDFEGEYVTWTTDGANAGTVSYRKGKFNCTNVCGTIQPINSKKINLKFLPYYLNLGTRFSVRLDINPKLMNNMMAKIPVIIPPKQEQTAIANYLDRKTAQIDELIADKKRLLELYEEEKTAIINQAVTKGINPDVPMKDSGIEWIGEIPEHWEVKKIKYISKLQGGYAFKSDLFCEDGIPIIRIGDINNPIDWDKCKKVPEELEIPDDFVLRQFDTLIALSGATTGKTTFINTKPEYAYINQRVAKVGFPNKLLYFNISSDNVQKLIFLTADGSAQENISNSQIENLEIVIPPTPEEQTAIVEYIETELIRINTKTEKTKKLIALLEEYRTALISEVVTGKIKVTD